MKRHRIELTINRNCIQLAKIWNLTFDRNLKRNWPKLKMDLEEKHPNPLWNSTVKKMFMRFDRKIYLFWAGLRCELAKIWYQLHPNAGNGWEKSSQRWFWKRSSSPRHDELLISSFGGLKFCSMWNDRRFSPLFRETRALIRQISHEKTFSAPTWSIFAKLRACLHVSV